MIAPAESVFHPQAAHPSPLSAHNGFFGCGHFKKINEILSNLGKKEINWQIENV